MTKCLSCGSLVPEAVFCDHCGATLRQTAPPRHLVGDVWCCGHCGKHLKRDGVYCIHCGVQFRARAYCQRGHRVQEFNAKYCATCAEPIDQIAPINDQVRFVIPDPHQPASVRRLNTPQKLYRTTDHSDEKPVRVPNTAHEEAKSGTTQVEEVIRTLCNHAKLPVPNIVVHEGKGCIYSPGGAPCLGYYTPAIDKIDVWHPNDLGAAVHEWLHYYGQKFYGNGGQFIPGENLIM